MDKSNVLDRALVGPHNVHLRNRVLKFIGERTGIGVNVGTSLS
jgi:hypothetical protein